MRRAGFLFILCVVWGCGEAPDELTPYVNQLHELSHFNRTIVQYKNYLRTEGMADKAADVAQVLTAYRDSISAIGMPANKHIRALHNSMIRSLDEALRRLVEPDFPTFVPNAERALRVVGSEMTVVINNFARMWEREGIPQSFPLVWPGSPD